MLPFEDIAFQLVDLAEPACAEHLLSIRAQLAQRRITLMDRWPNLKGAGALEQVVASHPLSQVYRGGPMLFDFSEPERNTARRALEIYLSDLREEIVKTEKHEWRQALHEEKEILQGVIEQLSI